MAALRLLLFAAALWAAYEYFATPPSIAVAGADGSLSYPGYTITPLASWSPEARILSIKSYHSDREADLAPVDLALGWDQMADREVLATFDIHQSNRWFFWRTEQLPFPRTQVTSAMSNVHIIPASARIAEQLRELKTGQRVKLTGQLVEVSATDGWRWRSSLSRTDTGKGSCELLWLETLTLLPG